MTQSGTEVALRDRLPHRSERGPRSVLTEYAVRFYRPELDVVRFCAFLMVFVSHAVDVSLRSPLWLKVLSYIPGFGVPLFFALSAYLVTELLMTERRLTGTVNVPYFYGRRILRIWPLYFALLGTGFVVSHLYPAETITVFALLSYMLLLGNWYTSEHGYLAFGLSPLWSISIEEQFYLVWPWILRTASVRAIAIISFGGWICSQGMLMYLCSHHSLNNPTEWTNTFVQIQYFAIGVGLSLFLNGSVPNIRGWIRFLIIISALLLFPAAELLFNGNGVRSLDERSSITQTVPVYLLGSISVMAILIGFLGCTSLESWRGVRYLGKISYGLYVFHPMAIGISQHLDRPLKRNSPIVMMTSLLLSIGMAWMSYEYIEKPFMRKKERLAIVKSRAV